MPTAAPMAPPTITASTAHRPALEGRAAPLAAAARPFEERQARELPELGELECEPLGGVVSPLEAPAAVRRNKRERVYLSNREPLADELRDLGGESPQPAFLPGVDEPPRRSVVADRRAGACEGESPA